MKVVLERTSKIVTVNGVPARIWEGQTASGAQVHAFITCIAVRNDCDQAPFEKELEQCRAPSADVAAIPARLVL